MPILVVVDPQTRWHAGFRFNITRAGSAKRGQLLSNVRVVAVCEDAASVFRLASRTPEKIQEHKKQIMASRVGTTQKLVDALARTPQEQRPKVLVSASAVGA